MIRPYELIYPLEDFPLFSLSTPNESEPPLKFGEVNGFATIEFDASGDDWQLVSVVLHETPTWDDSSQSWLDRSVVIKSGELDWPKRRLFNWIKLALSRDNSGVLEDHIREIIERDE